MALSYKARRRLSLLLLLVWLPIYIIIAATILSHMNGMNKVLQLLLYMFLGVAWALPFKPVFTGIGKADPDAPEEE